MTEDFNPAVAISTLETIADTLEADAKQYREAAAKLRGQTERKGE
jgi:hypothetical protein